MGLRITSREIENNSRWPHADYTCQWYCEKCELTSVLYYGDDKEWLFLSDEKEIK